MATDILYFDEAATTFPAPESRAAMESWLHAPANPHSRHHPYGAAAHRAVETARAQVAAAIGATAADIIFTSGATEAHNIFLHGIAAYLREQNKTHIITSAVEHKSIHAPLAALADHGFAVTTLQTKSCAMLEAAAIERALTPQTGLVTVQAVNNETGTIQPLAEIAALLKGRDILFHSDAAQAPGKCAFNVGALSLDAAGFCGHKIYGPAGIGALYIAPHLRPHIMPHIHGGGQEQGLRPGTLPTMLCAGFGAACERLIDDRARLQGLRDRLLAHLAPLKPEIFGHSDPAWNVPNILSLRFPGIDHDTLLMALPGLAFGIGSACDGTNGGKVRSAVITAIAGPQAADEAIRLSFGRYTTETDIDRAAAHIIDGLATIHEIQKENHA